jgi:hypothetical protein
MRRLLFGLFLAACAVPDESLPDAALSSQTRCAPPETGGGWHKLGVVRGLPEPERSGDGVIAPSLVLHEGGLHLWYTQKTGVTHSLFHTVSHDGGASFEAPVAVLGLGEGLNAYPHVWREQGSFAMLFGSGSIKLATSADGVRFTLAPSSVLSASFEADRFDALSVLYPNRVVDETGPVLYFSGYDGRRMRIGRAASREDGSFSVDPPHPVVDLGAAVDFDNTAVAQAHVQRISGQWRMWYGGYDTSVSNPGPYRIGSATSADGLVWKKHGVAVDLGAAGTDAWSTRDPVVVATKGSWQMFYVGLGDDGRYRLHRATNDACPSP